MRVCVCVCVGNASPLAKNEKNNKQEVDICFPHFDVVVSILNIFKYTKMIEIQKIE